MAFFRFLAVPLLDQGYFGWDYIISVTIIIITVTKIIMETQTAIHINSCVLMMTLKMVHYDIAITHTCQCGVEYFM